MSHISRIKTKIVEKEYLLAALIDLGYEVEEGETTIKAIGGQKANIDIKVRIRLSNDIGFRKTAEGYEIVADWYGVRGVKSKEFTHQVLQRYAYHTAKAKIQEQGFALIEEVEDKGKIRLVLRKMA
jgi:hypothetical protein